MGSGCFLPILRGGGKSVRRSWSLHDPLVVPVGFVPFLATVLLSDLPVTLLSGFCLFLILFGLLRSMARLVLATLLRLLFWSLDCLLIYVQRLCALGVASPFGRAFAGVLRLSCPWDTRLCDLKVLL